MSEAEQGRVVEFAIGGMTCAACSTRLEKVLNRQAGVRGQCRSWPPSTARIRSSGAADQAAVVTAVAKAGFTREAVDGQTVRPNGREAARPQSRAQALLDRRVAHPAAGRQMFFMWFGEHGHHNELPRWLQLALATPVQFWIGWRFYDGAWKALRGGGANMDVLVALGTSMAWGFSTVVTVFEGAAARLFRRRGRCHHAGAARQAAGGAGQGTHLGSHRIADSPAAEDGAGRTRRAMG